MRNLLAGPLLLLAQLVLAPPPPAGFQRATPQYATLSSPLSGQRFYRGQAVPLSFTDPGTTATEARFSLSNYTGVYLLGKASLKNKGRVSSKITLPNWVADGTYDFVVSENDGPLGSDEFNTDVVICTVFVGRARANQLAFAPFRNQAEQDQGKTPAENQTPAGLLQKREPHPPKFVTPLANQSFPAGSPISIKFLDGQLDPHVTQARFVLRPLATPTGPQKFVLAGPGASQEGLYTFNGVAIVANVTSSKGTPPGAYSLVAEEVDPKDSNRFQSVATIDILIVAEDAAEQDVSDIDQETEEETLLVTNHASLKKRSEASSAPQNRNNPTFISPTNNQKTTPGHYLNISFTNVDRKTDKMRFTLKPVSASTEQKELVLLSSNAVSEQLIDNATVCNARVSLPPAIASGTYKLVAEEVHSADNVKDVGSVQIQVTQLTPVQTLTSRDLLKKDGGLLKPAAKKIIPLFLAAVSENHAHGQLTVPATRQNKQHWESPNMLEPLPNQEVPSGSIFFCKIQDKHATSETARFVLRSFGGYEQYLGSAKFVNGVATLRATCPSNIRYDTYIIVALQNSVKKPYTFLDVISTSVIVSHARPLMMDPQAPLIPPKPSTSAAQLDEPVYNQYIPGGKVFECRLLNGANAERVKFFLRLGDGRSDLPVGNCQFKQNGVAQTMCQIPSSITPGTYMFVAQKSSKSQPNAFADVDQVVISLANPRGLGPDLASQRQATRVAKRSLETAHAEQVSVLLQPTSYQTIAPGQGFIVKMTKNTAPLSTMLRFLLKPMATSLTHKEYFLGTTSNDQAIDETLKCPDHIPNVFVIQANDPNDPEKFIDSSSTPIVVNSQSTPSNTTTPTTPSDTSNSTETTEDSTRTAEPTQAPLRYSDPRNPSPSSGPSSGSSSGPSAAVDRASTPLCQPFNARSSGNIFASPAAPSPQRIGCAGPRVGLQAAALIVVALIA